MLHSKPAYLQLRVHVCVGRDISEQHDATMISLPSPSEARYNSQLTFNR